MNSMERVLGAIQGTPVDRRPVALTLSLYGARLSQCPLKEYYTNPQRYLDGQLAVLEQCRPDVLFTPFALTAEAEAFGSERVFFDKGPPNIKKPAVGCAADFIKIPLPDIDSNPSLLYLREATRLLAASAKGTVPVAAITLNPVDLPAIVMGIDNWLETLLFDELATRLVLDKACAFFIAWANALLTDGANFIALPSMFTNPRIITKKIVEKTILPAVRAAFAEIKGPIVFHHGGNRLQEFMPLYTTLPNVAAFVIDSRDHFSEIRKHTGPERVLMGNINGPNLWRLKPEQVKELCEKILTERQDDPHFILATSDADIAYDTPLENITAIMDTVAAFKGRKGKG